MSATLTTTESTNPSDEAAASVTGTATRRGGFSHATGFWVIATAFIVATGFPVVTTPLWTIYQQQDNFSTFTVTVAFAIYAVGVLVALFLAGHVSDWMGRRTLLIPALVIEGVAAIGFIFWNDLAGLLVARFVSGIGIGMATPTATAHIFELHRHAHPGAGRARSDILSTAANIGGFGIGVIVASAIVQFAPAPTVTPYVVFLILLGAAAVAVALVPETVTIATPLPRYRPQRVRIPTTARTRYFAAAILAFAGFAVLGLFTSLAPSFVAGQLHDTSYLLGGAVVFATFASAAVFQIGVRWVTPRTAILIGTAGFITGFAAIIAGVATASLALFVIGGVFTGGATGFVFSTAISAAGIIASPENRGEVLAGIFLCAYMGLIVPVVGLGAATLTVSMLTALVGFSVFVVTVAIIGTGLFLHTPSPESATPDPALSANPATEAATVFTPMYDVNMRLCAPPSICLTNSSERSKCRPPSEGKHSKRC